MYLASFFEWKSDTCLHPGERFYQIGVPVALLYLAACYIFEGLYHFKYPIPGLIEEEEINKQQEDSSLEENQSEDLTNE